MFVLSSQWAEERQDKIQWCLDLLGPVSFSCNFLSISPKEGANNSYTVSGGYCIFNILWLEIKGISSLDFSSLSCGEGPGTCFGTLALVSCLWLSASNLRFLVQTFCHRPFQALMLIKESCNGPYPIYCSHFAFLLHFTTQFSLSPSSPSHSPYFLCCHFFPFPSCSAPLLTSHHHLSSRPFSLSLRAVCYTFQPAKKAFLWGRQKACRLRWCLRCCFNTLTLVFVDICSFPN